MNSMKRVRIPILSLLFLTTLIAPVVSQSIFGTILGTVRDTTGSVIPGATVKIINIDENTVRTVQSNDNGDYEAVNMKPGRHRIEVTATGFQTFNTSEVALVARQTLRIDAALVTGQVMATVDITANAGAITTGTQTISSSFGVTKSFYLTERVKLEAGVSFTNVTNHTNLADPQMNVTSTAFGRIASARASELGGSRTGQVSMRLSF